MFPKEWGAGFSLNTEEQGPRRPVHDVARSARTDDNVYTIGTPTHDRARDRSPVDRSQHHSARQNFLLFHLLPPPYLTGDGVSFSRPVPGFRREKHTAKPGRLSPSRARSGSDSVILAPRPAILALGPAVFHHPVFARPGFAHHICDSVTGFLDFDRDGECCLAHFCVTSTRITGKLEAFHFTDDGSGNRFSKTSIAARSSSNAGRVKRPYWGVLNRYCRSLQAFRSATIAM